MKPELPAPGSPIIIQVVGYKNSGKTTLIVRLTQRLKDLHYRVGTIKHDAHDFEIDKPGTDTWQHQAAGADITAITSSERTAILKKKPDTLQQLISQMSDDVHIILIEGFKEAPYPKVIMLRSREDFALMPNLENPLALVLWPEAETQLSLSAEANAKAQAQQAIEPGSLPRFALQDLDLFALLRLLNL